MSERVVIGVDFAHDTDCTSVAVFTNGNLNTTRPSWATMSAAEMIADLESVAAAYRRPRRPWSKALMRERLNRATRESRKRGAT